MRFKIYCCFLCFENYLWVLKIWLLWYFLFYDKLFYFTLILRHWKNVSYLKLIWKSMASILNSNSRKDLETIQNCALNWKHQSKNIESFQAWFEPSLIQPADFLLKWNTFNMIVRQTFHLIVGDLNGELTVVRLPRGSLS